MKHFNVNTNVGSNNNNNIDDDTYDDKLRDKIGNIRMILNRLGNAITNNDIKKI